MLLVVAQHFHDRRARFGVRFLELLEHAGFTHVGADVEADADQQRRQQERHAPAPAQERFFRHLPGHQREYAIGQQQPDWRRQLHQAAEDAAPLTFRVQLVDHDRRPAPLAAQGQALHHAQQHQQRRRQRARGGIGRQQADTEGGQAHHQQRDDQDRLAAHLVAEVAKDRRTQRPRHESHAVAGKGQQRRGQRIALREEQLGEDQRGGRSVDEVVVELKRGAGQAGPGDTRDGLLLGRRAVLGCCVDADCLHGGSSNGPWPALARGDGPRRRIRALSPTRHACAASLLSTLGYKPPYNQVEFCLSDLVRVHGGFWCGAPGQGCGRMSPVHKQKRRTPKGMRRSHSKTTETDQTTIVCASPSARARISPISHTASPAACR
ncbi:hypothetical protein D9M72_314610 [compost metagenome]